MQQWAVASQSQLKKNKKLYEAKQRKQQKSKEKQVRDSLLDRLVFRLCVFQEEDTKKREENLEKAKSIIIKRDDSLPTATKVYAPYYNCVKVCCSLRSRSGKEKVSGVRE